MRALPSKASRCYKVQTDNHYLADKVRLRVDHLPTGPVRVLDCFGGKGKVWTGVAKVSGRKDIYRIPVEIEHDKLDEFGLCMTAMNALTTTNLKAFNVIDLDAYGVPFDEIAFVLQSQFKGVVFVTFIQTVMGMLPHNLLLAVGFTKPMIEAAPTLCSRNGWEYIREYLEQHGVREIWHRSKARKHYFAFRLG